MEINISFFLVFGKQKRIRDKIREEEEEEEEEKEEEEEEKRRRKKEEGRRRDQMYGFVWFSMNSSMELVRNFCRDFVWIFGMNFCMDTCLGV